MWKVKSFLSCLLPLFKNHEAWWKLLHYFLMQIELFVIRRIPFKTGQERTQKKLNIRSDKKE